MNITELARQVNLPTKQLRQIIPELGFDIGMKAIQVDEKTAKKIITQLNNPLVRKKSLNALKPKKEQKKIEEETTSPKEKTLKTKKEENKIQIGENIIVKELARQMNMEVTKLILELMKNGVMASLNQKIDYETATIIAEDLGFKVEKIAGKKVDLEAETKKRKEILDDKAENLIPRPPVITVMGHVDHGKTKLLDAVRQTNVVEGEAGGITQHIGAYQVKKNDQTLTFVDTPGHAAFSAMRSRGAQVADIIILVVAADDGIQPQTIESISHIRSAGLPFIVAINKIDKPEANIDKIKNELAEIDLTPEDWGGKTICVEISAKQKQNIDGLLDTLLLIYDMEKENIQANPNRPAVGTIIESHLNKSEGPLATVLIQTGTLYKGDSVKIGNCFGKIKMMKNWQGKILQQAKPSMPARIMGLKSVPDVGEILQVIKDKKTFKKELKQAKNYTAPQQLKEKPITSSNKGSEGDEEKEIKQLNIILKTDVLGSQEAILESLKELPQDKVELNIINSGLGSITEVDVEKADKQNTLLIGFNVKANTQAELMARDRNVAIKIFKIIYELLDYVKQEMKKNLDVEIKTETIGKLKVLKIFRTEKKSQILGGKVIEGKIISDTKLNIYRNDELIGTAKLTALQSAKQDVTEVLKDQEAGMKVEGFNEIEENDIIEIVKEEEIKKTI